MKLEIRGVMRANRNRRVRLAGILLTGAGILGLSALGWSSLQRLWSGSGRIVSIQEFSDAGESCDRTAYEESRRTASAEESLFSAFQETTVHAQDANTVDITRPPVRD